MKNKKRKPNNEELVKKGIIPSDSLSLLLLSLVMRQDYWESKDQSKSHGKIKIKIMLADDAVFFYKNEDD